MLVAGKTLREERERRGQSLEAIAETTKIPRRILAAIEQEETSATQTPFFYKSFVKQYAEALHLNYSEIEEAVNANVRAIPVPLVPGQDHRAPDVAPIRLQGTGVRWVMPIFSLIAVMAACSALYAVVQNAELPHFASLQKLANEAASEIKTEVKSAASSITPSKSRAESQLKETARSARLETPAQSSTGPAAVPGEDIFLRIAAVERSWLSIEADGKSVYNGLLQPADTKVFEGHETARIRTGNAGGVTVTFNGKEIGRLGERGQVRTVLFTRDQYEILQPNLTSRLELLSINRVSE